ncbi:MAG: hypothetical protein HOQ05_06665 [Corynebacteriales bacterium]|nr:hypothetical protein [Mycobacteriales bacterium]
MRSAGALSQGSAASEHLGVYGNAQLVPGSAAAKKMDERLRFETREAIQSSVTAFTKKYGKRISSGALLLAKALPPTYRPIATTVAAGVSVAVRHPEVVGKAAALAIDQVGQGFDKFQNWRASRGAKR